MTDINEKDIGKKGKNFAKIESKAGKEYHDSEAGAKVAGAILAKLRAKHPLKYSAKVANEEVIDEISDDLATSYIANASKDLGARRRIVNRNYKNVKPGTMAADVKDTHIKAGGNRAKGIVLATKKLAGVAKQPTTEEVEQVDELSKKAIWKYMVKSDKKGDRFSTNRSNGMELAGRKRAGKPYSQVPATEEVEVVDELSHKLVSGYVAKAVPNKARAEGASEREWDKGHFGAAYKEASKAGKRVKGIDVATNKLKGTSKVPANEEEIVDEGKTFKDRKDNFASKKSDNFRKALKKNSALRTAARNKRTVDDRAMAEENIDELSRNTLDSYIDKRTGNSASEYRAALNAKDEKTSGKHMDKMKKHNKNMQVAYGKTHTSSGPEHKVKIRANEEAEQVDELSVDTLGSYLHKNLANKTNGVEQDEKTYKKRLSGFKLSLAKSRKTFNLPPLGTTAKVAAQKNEEVDK